MGKPYYGHPPTELRKVLGDTGYDYIARLHESVHGYGPDGQGSLDANNLAIEDDGTTTPSGRPPVLVADKTTGKLTAKSATVPVEDITASKDGILVGKTSGGKVASTEEASPYINHRQTADYVSEEHKPLDDTVSYDPAGTDAEKEKAANTVWSAKKIQQAIDAAVSSGVGAISHDDLLNLTADDHPQYHNDARADVWWDAKTSGKARTVRLDNSGFNGSATTFTNLLPSEPDLVNNEVILIHAGVGPLLRVSGVPTPGEFALSGGTNRTVKFGVAPDTGDQVYATYVQA